MRTNRKQFRHQRRAGGLTRAIGGSPVRYSVSRDPEGTPAGERGIAEPPVPALPCGSTLRVAANRNGFTLLELTFALLLTAIIVPILYGALVSCYKLKAAAQAAVEPPRTAEQAFDWLRQDLGNAVPPNALAATDGTPTLMGPFEGTQNKDDRGREADDIVFFSVADSPMHASANGEIKMIELTVITAPDGEHVLVRKVTNDLVSYLNGSPPDPDVEVICRGVDGFTLAYSTGAAVPIDSWPATWDSTAQDNTLPAAVAVTITLDRPGGPSKDVDGSPCYQYTRVIPLSCSTAAFDSTVNTGTVQ
jgi:type II secretory pathway pseudopilin PulG